MLNQYKNIINRLIKKKISLSVVESCTGGMLAEFITSFRGASKIFNFGIVTYSNQSKIQHLKVSSSLIKKYGSVSAECCRNMVKNLSKISKARINIAITGIAGPDGGTIKKPIGLVYIGIKKNKKILINRYFFEKKNRRNIRISAVKKSLELVKNLI